MSKKKEELYDPQKYANYYRHRSQGNRVKYVKKKDRNHGESND